MGRGAFLVVLKYKQWVKTPKKSGVGGGVGAPWWAP